MIDEREFFVYESRFWIYSLHDSSLVLGMEDHQGIKHTGKPEIIEPVVFYRDPWRVKGNKYEQKKIVISKGLER